MFEHADPEHEAAIDAGYETKYPDRSVVTVMQGACPEAAPVRISPR